MSRLIWIFLILFQVVTLNADKAYYSKLRQSRHGNYHKCLIIEHNVPTKFKGFDTTDSKELKVFTKLAVLASSDAPLTNVDESKIVEVFAKSIQVLDSHIESICNAKEFLPMLPMNGKRQEIAEDLDIEKIVDSGDQSNRIDVVFMGDGYTADERDQFFEDIRRLTEDMFNGDTFRSYLPLFNIWAIYVESEESGIGYNGAKDTPIQAVSATRAVKSNLYCECAICQLTGTSGCDYPSLIGNDDYYGGLGGEFVISTKSNRTGTVVLRHEMGHNFVNVGEEYDNGSAYRGVNSAANLTLVTTKWGHWLTDPNVREERAMYRLLQYPWADLSSGPQSFNFTSDGQYSRWYLDVSVSAAGEAESLEFVIDDEILSWESRGSDDREFYSWHHDSGFSEDDVAVSKLPNSDKTKRVELNTLKLAHLRAPGKEIEGENLEIRWFHGGQQRPEFDNQFVINAEGGACLICLCEFYNP